VRWKPGSPASSAARPSWKCGRPFNLIAQTVEDILNKGNATFSWRELVSDKPLTDSDKRAFIESSRSSTIRRWNRQDGDRRDPPGCQGSQFRQRIWRAGPIDRTGSDGHEEYATVQDGAIVNSLGTVVIV